MEIVEQIIGGMKVRRKLKECLVSLYWLWLAIPGRVNFMNLGRYGELSERSYRNWFEKPVEFTQMNADTVRRLQEGGWLGKGMVLGIDCSAIRKAGKATPNVGKYWDSKAGRAVLGLEMSCCSLIDAALGRAFALHGRMTPSKLPEGQSRMDHYLGHLHDVLGCLPAELRAQIEYVVADGYYAKQGFIRGVQLHGKHMVGSLRSDANLKYLYNGPKRTGPGRPKRYDGKVEFGDWSRWDGVRPEESSPATSAPSTTSVERIYTVLAYAPKIKQCLRVVAVVTIDRKGIAKHRLFFSTNLQQDPLEILDIYQSRYQMEFTFRDAKQFAGLEDCQSRQEAAIEFHWNMSLSVVNLTLARQLVEHTGKPQDFIFSIEDAKRLAYNHLFAKRFLSILPIQPTCPKYHLALKNLLDLGIKAA